MWYICASANCNFSIPLIIYWPSHTWKKLDPSIFPTFWIGANLKFTVGISLNSWSWLVTSSSWLRDFVSNGVWSVNYTLPNFNVAQYLEFKIPMVGVVHSLHPSLWVIYVKSALRLKSWNQIRWCLQSNIIYKYKV